MKINSEKLFGFINNLGTDEKVKFKVYYDDNYVTEIYWDGENFNWDSGTFTSGAFFDPLYDFEEIEEDKEIEQLQEMVECVRDGLHELPYEKYYYDNKEMGDKINELVIAVNKLKKESK